MKVTQSNRLTVALVLAIISTISGTLKAQEASSNLIRPGGLALPDRFTLVYWVTKTDVRTAAVRNTEAWIMRRQAAADSKSYPESTSHVETNVARLLKTQPRQTFTLTVSGRSGALFYKRQDGKVISHSLYIPQPAMTLVCENSIDLYRRITMNPHATPPAGVNVSNDQCNLYSGLQPGGMEAFPLPAAGIGPISLLKASSSASSVSTASGLVQRIVAHSPALIPNAIYTQPDRQFEDHGYGPATVDVQLDGNAPKVLDCVVYTRGGISDRWDYSGHEKCLGVWLPRHMTFTHYEVAITGIAANQAGTDRSHVSSQDISTGPSTQYTYDLVSAAPYSVSDRHFTMEGDLLNNSMIVNDNIGTPVNFVYKTSSGGTLMEQMDKARWNMKVERSKVEKGNLGGNRGTGMLVVGSAVCAACGWSVWRRRRNSVGLS